MYKKINKNISILNSIKKIYGVGKQHISVLKKNLGLNKRTKILGLKKKTSILFNSCLKRHCFLIKKKNNSKKFILKLLTIKSYRGVRHKLKYPVRGQRTHTNGKTQKKNSQKIWSRV